MDIDCFEGVELTTEDSIESTAITMLFYPEHNKLVCAGCTVSIISGFRTSGDEIGGLKIQKMGLSDGATVNDDDDVNQLAKWDENVFLVMKELKIQSYDVTKAKEVRTILTKSRSGYHRFYNAQRIDSDHFIVTTWGEKGQLLVVNYTLGEVTRKLTQIPVSAYSRIVLSKKFPKSFYFNRYFLRFENSVRLIDYEKDKVVKRYENHENNQINAIITYLNPQKDEILVYGCESIYFVNTTSEMQIKVIHAAGAISSIIDAGNGYFVATGRNSKEMKIIDSQNDFRVKTQNLDLSTIYTCSFLSSNRVNGDVRFVIGCRDRDSSSDHFSGSFPAHSFPFSYQDIKKEVRVMKIKGLRKGKDFLEEDDLKERITFLFEYLEQDDIQAQLLRIEVDETNLCTLYKSFMM